MSDLALREFARVKWIEAKRSRLNFVHVHCHTGCSDTGVRAVIHAFAAAAAADEGPVSISYLLRSPADVIIAGSRYNDAVNAIREQGNLFTFMTYAAWKDDAAHDRQILLFDWELSTMSSMNTILMLEIRQQLQSRAQKAGFQCLVVTVAPYWELVWNVRFHPSEQGCLIEGHNFQAAEYRVKDWKGEAMDIMKRELNIRLDTLPTAPGHQMQSHAEEYGPIFVLLMRYNDARYLFEQLKQVSPNIEFGCVMPWSDLQSIEAATSRSRWLKIVYIDDGVFIMPLIEDSQVVIGPTRDLFRLSKELHSVVTTSNVWSSSVARFQKAISLSPDTPLVHTFVPANSRHVRTDILSPAWGSQLLHFWFGLIKACKGGLPVVESIRVPDNRIMSVEAQRQLEVWGLISIGEKLREHPKPKIQHPLGTHAARFSRLTTNINSMMLLSCITEDMSNAIVNILIDMAVLVCQGPSAIFYPATSAAKIEAADRIRLLNGPLAPLVDRGQLWLSLACLNAYRNGRMTEALSSMLRKEVISRVLDRTAHIKTWFGIDQDDSHLTLAPRDVSIVEDQLARAFLFNILLTDETKDYFAVDLTSRARLYQADDDPLDWNRLHGESDIPGIVAGVYTYIEFPLDDDSKLVEGERPHDVTVLSLRAVSKALDEVGGVTSLWPGPEDIWPSPEDNASLRIHKDEITEYFEEFELGEDLSMELDEVEAYTGPSATV